MREIAAAKQKLRKQFQQLRQQKQSQKLSENFLKQLSALLEQQPKGLWASYRALAGEADIDSFYQDFLSLEVEQCFPRVEKQEIHFYRVQDWQEDFEQSAWQIWEPKSTCELIKMESLSACLVPLLAFDSNGYRLGMGKGFYDRFLANFQGTKIGVAFDWQYSSTAIPIEAHDQKLDYVITDSQIHSF